MLRERNFDEQLIEVEKRGEENSIGEHDKGNEIEDKFAETTQEAGEVEGVSDAAAEEAAERFAVAEAVAC